MKIIVANNSLLSYYLRGLGSVGKQIDRGRQIMFRGYYEVP